MTLPDKAALDAQATNVANVVNAELVRLQKDASLPHLPTQLTYQLRMAVSGHDADEFGSWGYQWKDKPHRLVYEACGEIERIAALRAEPPADVAELVETWREVAALVAPAGTRFGEARRNAAECLREAADALASLSRRNAELEAEVAAAGREEEQWRTAIITAIKVDAARWPESDAVQEAVTAMLRRVEAIRALGEKP